MQPNSPPPFEKHRKLLLKMSYQFHRRCVSAGAASVLQEDVYQEMCIAWCIARDKWDANTQVPFTAYLVRGIRNHVNRWIDKEIIQAHDKLDLDASGDDSKDMEDMHSLVADRSAQNPESAAIEQDDRRNQELLLSAEARQFIGFLESPPPALFQVLEGMKARRAYAEQRGIAVGGAAKKITANLIFDLMGCDKPLRDKVVKEIRAFSNLELMANG